MLTGMRMLRCAVAGCCFFALPAVAEQVSVVDDFGRTVTLRAPAMRILSLGPHITENLFSAGAGGKVVGGVEHSDYPPAAKRIPSVGGGYAQINLEAVIALSPDLVVAWQTAANRDSVDKIAALGYPVYYSEPRGFDGIIENIEELAHLAGTGADINSVVAGLRDELKQVRARFAGEPTLKVFYQIWQSPLTTLNGDHYISRALELCGARNVFANLPIIAPRVGIEAVLQADPDIIILGDGGGDDDWTPDVSMWRKWSSLSAVRRDGFVFVNGNIMHRHTARMIMNIRRLCEDIDGVRKRNP